MRRHFINATVCSLLCIPAAAQEPAPEEQKRTLGAAREIAIHYTNKLPDFICTEQVKRNNRTNRASGPAIFTNDRLTIQLSYSGQKEHYKLVAMNGIPTKDPLSSLDGLITGGEFGSQLAGVFNPDSSADFKWKQSSKIRKRAVAVYTYRIARANSHYMVGDRADNGKIQSAAAGYHGEVFLDSTTSRVFRLTAETDDVPKEFDDLHSSVEVDYDFFNVAGRNHLLPSHSKSQMEHSGRQIANEVTFTDYKKFVAESTVDFGH